MDGAPNKKTLIGLSPIGVAQGRVLLRPPDGRSPSRTCDAGNLLETSLADKIENAPFCLLFCFGAPRPD
jgi:hypothetical protein